MLHKEILINAPLNAVWAAWTTNEGLRFVSEESNVELRLDGPYEWFLNGPADAEGIRGSEGSRVLAFLPEVMLAFAWTFPTATPGLRASRATTQVVVQLEEAEAGVRVRLTQHGWQEGEEWDEGYRYFDEAWTIVLDDMKKHLEAH